MPTLRPILLAEDSPQDVELILRALRELRLANEIAVVGDGQQALDYLYRRAGYAARESPQPAVVLLDLKMPRVDGREVLRALRSDPDFRTLPVVVLTSSSEERDVLESYNLGANAYVVKPLDFGEFKSAVEKVGLFWALVNHPPSEPAR